MYQQAQLVKDVVCSLWYSAYCPFYPRKIRSLGKEFFFTRKWKMKVDFTHMRKVASFYSGL